MGGRKARVGLHEQGTYFKTCMVSKYTSIFKTCIQTYQENSEAALTHTCVCVCVSEYVCVFVSLCICVVVKISSLYFGAGKIIK